MNNSLQTIKKNRQSLLPSFFNDDFFSEFFSFPSEQRSIGPATNIREHEKEVLMDIIMPGLEKSDIKISINGGVMTIEYQKEQSNESDSDSFLRKEFSFSSFARSFSLPDNIKENEITSKLEDGILKINMPKSEVKQNTIKTIDIQ